MEDFDSTVPRRTQQERRESTRRRLLDAAVSELVARGYARITTSDVCRAAELSQGALFKHFATKADLVGAAASHLFDLLIEDYRRLFATAAADEDPAGTAIHLLWRTFNAPHVRAALDLFAAARTDPELSASLAPALEAHRKSLRKAARELFPKAAKHRNFDVHVRALHNAMQGAALWRLVGEDEGGDEMIRYLAHLTRLLMRDGL